MKIDWKKLGRHLKKMREDGETGLREAAREAGIGHATWCRAEQGKPLSAAHFMGLCAWMGEPPYTYFRQ